ncbi:MAG: Xylose isomerase protein barrel [Edaphobacter sp.]|nr:Xylose isomerase protein barrel [Edaphobacter sp.]
MDPLNRRRFLQLSGTALVGTALPSIAQANSAVPRLGLVAKVGKDGTSEETIKYVHDLGFSVCQIFLEALSMDKAPSLLAALKKYNVDVSAVSEHNPGPRVFDFDHGPPTIGIVPQAYRQQRIDALKLAADFASACKAPAIHTHLGFIPEDPNDPLYPTAVASIKEIASYCKGKGVSLLCETGEETPITMLRMIQDVGTGNVFVNLDTANLILYGKGNPVDAIDVFGTLVRGTHMKDGLFPTNPHVLGEEVAIGKGKVDFPTLFQKLKEVNYRGPFTIEREISGPAQIADILQSKIYLQNLIDKTYR